MGSKSKSISSTVEADLTHAINTAINTNKNFSTKAGIRSIAIETIRDIHSAWSTQSSAYNNTHREQHHGIDKLHLVYTAAQRLNRYRDQPGALPPKIIACFTKNIQERREITVGVLEEILNGADKVQMTQKRRIETGEAAELHILTPTNKYGEKTGEGVTEAAVPIGSKLSKKRKAVAEVEDDMGGGDDMTKTAGPEPQKKKKRFIPWASDSKIPTMSTKDEAKQVLPKHSAKSRDSNASPTTITSKPKPPSKSPPKSTKGSGPGNFKHLHSTTWYEDEEHFTRNLMVAHPEWTFKQLGEANTAKFAGTYAEDPVTGKKLPGMREGRSGNAVRLHLRDFKKAMASGGGQQAQGAVGAVGSTLGGFGTTNLGYATTSAASGATNAGVGATNAGNGTINMVMGASGVVSGTEPAAVRIFASGRVVGDGDGENGFPLGMSGMNAMTEAARIDGADRSEPGEDENPLDDLETMVELVEDGAF